MEWEIKRHIYDELAAVWTGKTSREFTADCVVPDTMPDIGIVADADGILLLRSKETDNGSIRLAAAVSASVLYAPEGESGLKSMPVSIPVELAMDAPEADTDCFTTAELRIRAIEARAVNSRKISVRAEVEAEAASFRKNSSEIAEQIQAEQGAVHARTEKSTRMIVSDVREKAFVVTDEYALPAGSAAVENILSQKIETLIEDAKFVSGKVVFRGRVRAWLVFSCGEDRVFSGRYETEFSQIMEMDAEGEAEPEVSLLLTGAYFDLSDPGADSQRISAEIHLVAQTVCRQKQELEYVSDLYSNRTCLLPRMQEINVVTEARPVTMRQTVTGRAEPAVSAGEVISVSASVGGITREENTVKTAVNIRMLCRQEEGGYAASRCRLSAEFTLDVPAEAELTDISVTVTDVYCGGSDVRAVLQMRGWLRYRGRIRTVDEIEEDAEAWAQQKESPSVTLVRVGQKADLWLLAKKYHSTVESISAANGGKEAGLLLIPKAR